MMEIWECTLSFKVFEEILVSFFSSFLMGFLIMRYKI
jgi:hypothetical protein